VREPVVEIIVIAIEVEMKSSSTRARVCADDDDRSIVNESTSCDEVYGSIYGRVYIYSSVLRTVVYGNDTYTRYPNRGETTMWTIWTMWTTRRECE